MNAPSVWMQLAVALALTTAAMIVILAIIGGAL
jgi:uncharacterized protein (DUF983 family)